MAVLDDPRMPGLDALTVTIVPASAGFAAAVLGALGAPSVAAARSDHFLWLTMLLAAPALVLFVRNFPDRPLPTVWRILWALAAFAWLGHAHYHLGTIFRDDLRLFLSVQGFLPAALAIAATGFWFADIVLAWAMRQRPMLILVLRTLTHLLVFVTLAVEALLTDASPVTVLLGSALLLAVLVAAVLRIRAPA